MAQILMPYAPEKESTLDKLVKIATVAKAGGDIYKDVSDISSKAALEAQKKDPNSALNQGFQKPLQGTPYQGKTIYELEKSGTITGANDFLKQTADQAVKASAPITPETQLEKGFIQVDPGTKGAIAAPVYDPVTKTTPVNWYVKKPNPLEGIEAQLKALNITAAGQEIDKRNRELAPNSGNLKPNQYAAAGFANRIADSEKVFGKLDQGGFDPTDQSSAIQRSLPGFLEGVKSNEFKQQQQAERNFVNAVLRRESGAAISNKEFADAEAQYFPRAGDTPDVLKQKAENRASKLAELQAEAGNQAMDEVKGRLNAISGPSGGQGTQVAVPTAVRGISTNGPETRVVEGVTYEKILGGWKAKK